MGRVPAMWCDSFRVIHCGAVNYAGRIVASPSSPVIRTLWYSSREHGRSSALKRCDAASGARPTTAARWAAPGTVNTVRRAWQTAAGFLDPGERLLQRLRDHRPARSDRQRSAIQVKAFRAIPAPSGTDGLGPTGGTTARSNGSNGRCPRSGPTPALTPARPNVSPPTPPSSIPAIITAATPHLVDRHQPTAFLTCGQYTSSQF
jgi:hypothetical protein